MATTMGTANNTQRSTNSFYWWIAAGVIVIALAVFFMTRSRPYNMNAVAPSNTVTEPATGTSGTMDRGQTDTGTTGTGTGTGTDADTSTNQNR